MMSSRMPWPVLLALAGPVVAQLPTPTLVARQDPSPSHVLVFNAVDQPVSCASTVISWLYAGPDVSLSLLVTNISVPQDGPTTESPPNTFTNTFTNKPSRRSLERRDDILLQIASGLSPSIHTFDWTVKVPQGNYVVTAVIQTSPEAYVARSSPFFVQQGTDTSCLSANPSSSNSSSNPPDTSTSSPTTSSTATTSSSLPTVPPIGGSSSTPINKGAIAGGVVAGAAVLLGALGLYLFFLCRPKRDRSSRNRSASVTHPSSKSAFAFGGGGGRWGGLSSVDSHMAMHDTILTATPKKSKKPYVAARHQSQASSVGPFAAGVGASQDDINSRSGSVAQQYGYPGSPSEEKFGSPDELGLASLANNGARSPKANAHSYSSSTFASELGAAAPAAHRRPSLTNTQAKPPRASIDSTIESQQQSPFTPHPTSPVVIARSPSTGTQPPAQRKTPRKPVPAYTDSSSSAPTPSPVSPAISPFDSPILPTGGGRHYATRAERESSLKSTSSNTKSKSKSKERSKSKGRKGDGSSTNASSEELGPPGQPEGTLVHKSSFGPGGVEGKQLHYLIPDMPVGQ